MLWCAFHELGAALTDRRADVFRTRDNHPSPRSIGSIALLAIGFEAWTLELAGHYRFFGKEPSAEELSTIARINIWKRLHRIAEFLGGTQFTPSSDLRTVLDLRDELVHNVPIPRQLGEIPHWFKTLEDKSLLLSTGNPKAELTFPQRLQSYKLAFWAWRVIDAAVQEILSALATKVPVGWNESLGSNFRLYLNLCPPEELARFDEELGLELRVRAN